MSREGFAAANIDYNNETSYKIIAVPEISILSGVSSRNKKDDKNGDKKSLKKSNKPVEEDASKDTSKASFDAGSGDIYILSSGYTKQAKSAKVVEYRRDYTNQKKKDDFVG